MAFEYIKDITSTDDIIEHILMRLNTDFEGGCLQVPDFCYIEEKNYYDPTMEMLVRDKMYKHGVAKRCQGRGQSEKAIALTPKGVEVFKRGGWKKYLVAFKEQEMKKKPQTDKTSVVVNGTAVIGNNNSHIYQERDLNNLSPTRNIPPQQAQPSPNPIKKTDHGIWDKIKYISVIIGGLGAALAASISNAKQFGWWPF